jgi:hypothetical protein
MSSYRTLQLAALSVGLFALQAQISQAKAPAHGHHHPPAPRVDHSEHQGNGSQNVLPNYANSWPYLRAENGIFGPVWAAPGPGNIFGGAGFGGSSGGGGDGGGWGWGGGWGFGYQGDTFYRPPYFDIFPPVYYTYSQGAIIPNPTLSGSQSAGGESAAQAASAAPTTQGSPPLRIINPYYNSGK